MSVNIARELGLGIARFIDGKIEAAMWAQQEQAGALRGTAAANVHRDLEYFRIAAREETEALVANEPAGLPKIWHQALRGCIGDGAEWRNPRIVTPQVRRSDWPAGDEVTVRCSDINLADPLRVLESIESYRAHPFFVPDLDPWDLRLIHPPPQSGRKHECWLPRPTQLQGVRLHDLDEHLGELRDGDWKTETHCFYLPPRDWKVGAPSKGSWRAGRGFPRSMIDDHAGWLDRNGYVWEWHEVDREWDVQLPSGGHLDVAPDGTLKR
jgi:hypothetical protein